MATQAVITTLMSMLSCRTGSLIIMLYLLTLPSTQHQRLVIQTMLFSSYPLTWLDHLSCLSGWSSRMQPCLLMLQPVSQPCSRLLQLTRIWVVLEMPGASDSNTFVLIGHKTQLKLPTRICLMTLRVKHSGQICWQPTTLLALQDLVDVVSIVRLG